MLKLGHYLFQRKSDRTPKRAYFESMKRHGGLSRIIKCAAYVLASTAALAQSSQLSLKHGTYVDVSVSCKDAPFAATQSWDGIGFSGPHSSKCSSRIVRSL